jgi:hypothetical protein
MGGIDFEQSAGDPWRIAEACAATPPPRTFTETS